MRILTTILCLGLLACKQTVPPKAIPIAPTVRKPVPTKPVDLATVKRDLGPVTESNRQLYQQILEGKQSIYELNRKLRSLEKSRVATAEEWERLTTLGNATENALSEAERVRIDQKKAIDALEITVATKGIEIAEAEAEKINLREAVDEANGRIDNLVTAHNGAVETTGKAIAANAVIKGERDAERRWKWRFFGWAVIATTSLGLLIYLKLAKPF